MSNVINKTIHQGHNVKRFREMLGIKQEALALALGDDWSQQKVSLLEAKESIDPGLLEDVARMLKVPVEAIKNFDEESAINIIGNTVTNHDNASVFNYYPTFNPFEKMVELYERLILVEKEKNALLEKLLENKKG